MTGFVCRISNARKCYVFVSEACLPPNRTQLVHVSCMLSRFMFYMTYINSCNCQITRAIRTMSRAPLAILTCWGGKKHVVSDACSVDQARKRYSRACLVYHSAS